MSANIEALVSRTYASWIHAKGTSWTDHMRNALTEQAEAFKGELQAYDGMVRELTKTVEDMRAAQSEPEHIRSIKIPTDTMEQEFQTHYRRGFEAGKKSVQPVAVVGDVVAITGEPIAILRREIGEDTWFDWTPVLPNSKTHQQLKAAGEMDYCEVYQRYTQSITSTELATLREKAAMVDEAHDVLRTLACELGAGGYNAEIVDASVFEHKIRDGVNMLLNPLMNRVSQAEQERDELRKDAPNAEVGAAIQRAAKELPEGCDIYINTENGAATVELYLAGTDTSYAMDVDADNRLAAEIHTAIDAAIAQGKGE